MKVQFATNYDDWEALYIDGKLVEQNHRLSPEQIIKALGFEFEKIEVGAEKEFPKQL